MMESRTYYNTELRGVELCNIRGYVFLEEVVEGGFYVYGRGLEDIFDKE